jgi:MoaA/NifB/PqqE/SkfB family radical SAM enzyme
MGREGNLRKIVDTTGQIAKLMAVLTYIYFDAWATRISHQWSIRRDFYKMLMPGKSFLQWFFTKECNHICDYCDITNSDKEDMNNEERKEKLSFLKKKYNFKLLIITGGEPAKKFDELIDFIAYSRKLGFIPALNTNGVLLTNDRIEELAFAGLRFITFSYDGVPPKNNEKIFEKAGEAFFDGIISSIQPVFTKKNWDKRMDIYTKSREEWAYFNPSIVNTLGRDFSTKNAEAPPEEEVREFFKILYSDKSLRMGTKMTTTFLEHLMNNYDNPWICQNFNWLTVTHDGRLGHCQEFSSKYTIDDLADPEKEKAFWEFREKSRDSCLGCNYECYYDGDKNAFANMKWADFLKIEGSARLLVLSKIFKRAEKIFERAYGEKITA